MPGTEMQVMIGFNRLGLERLLQWGRVTNSMRSFSDDEKETFSILLAALSLCEEEERELATKPGPADREPD